MISVFNLFIRRPNGSPATPPKFVPTVQPTGISQSAAPAVSGTWPFHPLDAGTPTCDDRLSPVNIFYQLCYPHPVKLKTITLFYITTSEWAHMDFFFKKKNLMLPRVSCRICDIGVIKLA